MRTPATLRVEIETESLKKVVEDGRLMEFVETASALAAQQIRYQVVERLAEAGVGIHQLEEAVIVRAGILMDDEFGTRPPIPFPPRRWGELVVVSPAGQVMAQSQLEGGP
jgi:hypothetical protein